MKSTSLLESTTNSCFIGQCFCVTAINSLPCINCHVALRSCWRQCASQKTSLLREFIRSINSVVGQPSYTAHPPPLSTTTLVQYSWTTLLLQPYLLSRYYTNDLFTTWLTVPVLAWSAHLPLGSTWRHICIGWVYIQISHCGCKHIVVGS